MIPNKEFSPAHHTLTRDHLCPHTHMHMHTHRHAQMHTHTHTHTSWSRIWTAWSRKSWSCGMSPHIHCTFHTQTPHIHTNKSTHKDMYTHTLHHSTSQLWPPTADNMAMEPGVWGCVFVGVVWVSKINGKSQTNWYIFQLGHELVSCNTERSIEHTSLRIVMPLPWQPACWKVRVSHEHNTTDSTEP